MTIAVYRVHTYNISSKATCLRRSCSDIFTDENCTTNISRRYAHVMHWAEVPYVPLDTCREIFRPVVKVKIIPGMLCGGELI